MRIKALMLIFMLIFTTRLFCTGFLYWILTVIDVYSILTLLFCFGNLSEDLLDVSVMKT